MLFGRSRRARLGETYLTNLAAQSKARNRPKLATRAVEFTINV